MPHCLLQGSCINPKLSVYAQLHGHFDCDCMPMAPTSICFLILVKPQEDCTTCSPHGKDGWYTGPALELLDQCYTVWVWALCSTQICDMLTWLPAKKRARCLLHCPHIAFCPALMPFCMCCIIHCHLLVCPWHPLAPPHITTTHHLLPTSLHRSVVSPPAISHGSPIGQTSTRPQTHDYPFSPNPLPQQTVAS